MILFQLGPRLSNHVLIVHIGATREVQQMGQRWLLDTLAIAGQRLRSWVEVPVVDMLEWELAFFVCTTDAILERY